MSKDINIDLKALPAQLKRLSSKTVRYVPLLIFLLVAIIYGLLLVRITTLSSAKPDPSDVGSSAANLTPHIDKSAAAQLEGLQDNSVNVQTLFNEARQSPFDN